MKSNPQPPRHVPVWPSMKPKAAPASRMARLGPWFTVAAVLLNVTLNLAVGPEAALSVGILQIILVPALTLTGLIVSVVGIRQTRDGRLSGRGSAVTGMWLAIIYLVITSLSLIVLTVQSA